MDLTPHYRLQFPSDLTALANLARTLRPDAPELAFKDLLGITLAGPCDLLLGRFPSSAAPVASVLHHRAASAPPELHVIMTGDDGWQCGVWFDDPNQPSAHVVAGQGTLEVVGSNVLEALRWRVEERAAVASEEVLQTALAAVRNAIRGGVEARLETGAAYLEAFRPAPRSVTVTTEDGLGVVLAGDHGEAPLDEARLAQLRDFSGSVEALEADLRAVRGHLPSLLRLGRDLLGHPSLHQLATAMLSVAYASSGRDWFGAVLRATQRNAEDSPIDVVTAHAGLDLQDLVQETALPALKSLLDELPSN